MKRSFANRAAGTAMGLAIASFLTSHWLTHSYTTTHPKSPKAEAGLVHALCDWDECVFVNDIESTGPVLLQVTSFLAFATAILLFATGKVRFILSGRGMPVSEFTDAEKREYATFWPIAYGSLAIFALVFYLRGAAISAFLVSLGIVLDV